MAAYAVIARIGRVEPQLTVRALERDLEQDLEIADDLATTDSNDAGAESLDGTISLEIVREPGMGRFAERLERMRELWTQTTFFLFDADSWRT